MHFRARFRGCFSFFLAAHSPRAQFAKLGLEFEIERKDIFFA